MASSVDELAILVERLDKTSQAYGIEISAEKTKLMTYNPNGIKRNIKVEDQKLKAVNSFRYLGAVISEEGSKQNSWSDLRSQQHH